MYAYGYWYPSINSGMGGGVSLLSSAIFRALESPTATPVTTLGGGYVFSGEDVESTVTDDGDLVVSADPNEIRFPFCQRDDLADGQEYGTNVLGIKYTDTGGYVGVLIEEVRTNSLKDSDDFSDSAAYGVITTTNTPNAGTDIYGGSAAMRVEDDNAAGIEFLQSAAPIVFSSGQTWTASVYVGKDAIPASTRFPMIRVIISNGGTYAEINVTLDTSNGNTNAFANAGLATIIGSGAIDSGNYWRLYLTVTDSTANTRIFWNYYPAVGANANLTTFSNGAVGSQLIGGAQLELGRFPSTLVPTTTAAAQRSADVLRYGSANYSDEMTVRIVFTLDRAGNLANLDQHLIEFDLGANTCELFISSTGILTLSEIATGTVNITNAGALAAGTYKVAFTRSSAADSTAYLDGVEFDTLTSQGAQTSATCTDINVGTNKSNILPLNGTIRDIAIWNKVLTAGELIEVTT